MVSQSHGRAAACMAAAILAANAGVQFYWGLGGTWAGEAPLSGSDQIREVGIGLVGLMYAGVLLVRAGYWHEHMPSAVARFSDLNAWVVVILPLVVAIQAFGLDDPLGGAIDLIIAALAFVVVRSERPLSPTSGAAPTPRRMPGPPTSAR
jgi:hypothetical protein